MYDPCMILEVHQLSIRAPVVACNYVYVPQFVIRYSSHEKWTLHVCKWFKAPIITATYSKRTSNNLLKRLQTISWFHQVTMHTWQDLIWWLVVNARKAGVLYSQEFFELRWHWIPRSPFQRYVSAARGRAPRPHGSGEWTISCRRSGIFSWEGIFEEAEAMYLGRSEGIFDRCGP